MKKDYCTWWWDKYRGVDISECCKNHDNNCGTSNFYKCLKSKLGWFHATYISFGGMIGCLVKYFKV